MPEPTSDRGRVEYALQTERDGTSFYEHASKHTAHKLARAAFETLAKEEIRHVTIIESLAKFLDGKDADLEPDSPSLKDLENTIRTIYGTASAEMVEGDLDPAEAYAKAVELEKRIAALYYRYSQECETSEAKRVFDVLYVEEQDHLSLLEDMLRYVTNSEQWFTDREATMMDGG